MHRFNVRVKFAAATAALLLVVAGSAWADPPTQAIRLAYVSGAVSFLPSGESEWTQARINRPLWTGDRLWSDRGARAELQIGGATLFFAPETIVSILNFDDQHAQFEVTQGTVYVNVRSLESGDTLEIDTPNLAFVVRRPGSYRLEVRPDGESTAVAVERGEAEAFGARAGYVLRAGERFRFRGSDLADYQAEPMYARAPFDTWVAERIRIGDRSPSARYVSADTIGYADLDAYGTWRTVATYGPIWVPSRVDTGWAPYRSGHWAWVDPWGWTWIDDAPWGFAPFHYGRWAYVDNRYWGWVPGPRNVRPVYAPALVAFVGGDNFRISASSGPTGGVAWFPLAPGEVYRPAYTASRDYFTRVNVTNTVVNVTNVTNVYNNPRATDVRYVNVNNVNAVTAVPTQTFVQAQPVQRAAVRVDREALQRTPVVAGATVAPVRASVTGGAPAAQGKPTQQIIDRPVVARATPPVPPPSFDRRQDAMKQQPGKPLDRADMAKMPPSAAVKPNIKVVEAAPAAAPIPPAAAQNDRGRAAQGEAPRPAQAPAAQPPVAVRPQPAAKAPEPVRPTQAAPAAEPQRAQPLQAQNDRERRAPPPAAAPAPTPPPAAAKSEPPRPTQAMPAPEQPRAQPPQAQNDRERRAPPPAAAAPAPTPPPAAAKSEPPRPTQAMPAPEQPRAQPPQVQNDRERRTPPPAAAAPAPTQAMPAPSQPPPRAAQPQPQPQPQQQAQPAARPSAATPAPEAPQKADQQQQGRRAARDGEADKAPPGKSDKSDKEERR